MSNRDIDSQICFLNPAFPYSGKYWYAKTELSEIAPRPSWCTLDLLDMLYAKNGPIDRVYRKYGVRYSATRFLTVIGNELYVDKERELQGLLPAYSYFCRTSGVLRLCNFSKIVPTLWNVWHLNRIRTQGYDQLFDRLKSVFWESIGQKPRLEALLARFLEHYELIFEINILSGLSVKRLQMLIKNDPVMFSDIAGGIGLVDMGNYHLHVSESVQGNSLDIADESLFVARDGEEQTADSTAVAWWEQLPEYRKKMMRNVIIEVAVYSRLREIGRWLVVKHISGIRKALLEYAAQHGFKNPRSIFFASLSDVIQGCCVESECIRKKEEYDQYTLITSPPVLTSWHMEKKETTVGVSRGSASGILVDTQMIERGIVPRENSILYTELLSPELTKYLDVVKGIVSHKGGFLSHLAIIAREKNIPVVVGFSVSGSRIKLGDRVRIDGSGGTVIQM